VCVLEREGERDRETSVCARKVSRNMCVRVVESCVCEREREKERNWRCVWGCVREFRDMCVRSLGVVCVTESVVMCIKHLLPHSLDSSLFISLSPSLSVFLGRIWSNVHIRQSCV